METEASFTLIGIIIAGVLGVVRTYYPRLPEPLIPVVVIGLASLFVAIGLSSGEIQGGLTLQTINGILNQGLIALGVGRGTAYLSGKTDDGASRLTVIANTVLPKTPPLAPPQ